MVKIISDSTCDLSKYLLEKYNVTTIPLHINLGEKEYRDGIDIVPDGIYEWVDNHNTTPKTSAVSMDDAKDAMKKVIEEGDEIIVFSISSEMSTTNNIFHIVAEELEAEDKISVIDSRSLSTGIGLLVIEAAIMALAKENRETIVSHIESLIPKVRASFVIDTLTYLHKGGRCSSLASLAGGMLKLHPKIIVTEGKMTVQKKYRGAMSSVVLRYVDDMKEDIISAKRDRVFITHSGYSDEVVEKVKQYLLDLKYFDEVLVTRAGGVISSHCGPGTLGVLFIED